VAKGHVLAKEIQTVTATFPREELYGITSQLRRAAVSVPSNIAEGHGRLTDRSFAVFLAQARGSLFEMETQLELARDFGYLGDGQWSGLLERCTEVARLINGLLRTIRASEES